MGTILTLTMLIFTALSVTREIERGTMESLLSMPIRPVEIMLGKIAPYVMVGAMQMTLILVAANLLFDVPIVGDLGLLVGAQIMDQREHLAEILRPGPGAVALFRQTLD
jgi:ABC-2 type transport system permease protein